MEIEDIEILIQISKEIQHARGKLAYCNGVMTVRAQQAILRDLNVSVEQVQGLIHKYTPEPAELIGEELAELASTLPEPDVALSTKGDIESA